MHNKLVEDLKLNNKILRSIVIDWIVYFDKFEIIDLKEHPEAYKLAHYVYKKVLQQKDLINKL